MYYKSDQNTFIIWLLNNHSENWSDNQHIWEFSLTNDNTISTSVEIGTGRWLYSGADILVNDNRDDIFEGFV